MKLLIVDDSVCVRGLLKRMLGGLCEAIYVCADGVSERSGSLTLSKVTLANGRATGNGLGG